MAQCELQMQERLRITSDGLIGIDFENSLSIKNIGSFGGDTVFILDLILLEWENFYWKW